MKRLIATLALALFAAAASADWRANATTLTWFGSRPTAAVTELRDALLWRYESKVLDGLFATAARPSIGITDLGGGNSELTIALPLAAGNAWVTSIATRCPEATTTATRRACADAFIRQDMRDAVFAYRQHLATPIVTPDFP
jgi:hypothetical protein